MEIKITDIKIFKINPRGALVGYANIVINDSFIIRGIKILEREDKRFVAMPARKLNQERKAYRDLCHPVNQKTREMITKAILDAYDANIEK